MAQKMPLFNLNFSWTGLALGWGVRRFHDDIKMFSNPTEFGVCRKHPSVAAGGRCCWYLLLRVSVADTRMFVADKVVTVAAENHSLW